MTYQEFKKIVEDTGEYYVNEDEVSVFVMRKNFSRFSIRISKLIEDVAEFKIDGYGKNGGDLIRAALVLAETPLDEREPEKRYYLRHKLMSSLFDNSKAYLISKTPDVCYLGSIILCDKKQAQFTKKEIEDIKNEFDVTLSDFEMIEVKE